MSNSLLSSKNVEYYSPELLVSAAEEVQGKADVDPATSIIANELVGAKKTWTLDDFFVLRIDPLQQGWDYDGHPSVVFMNPPGGRLHYIERVRRQSSRIGEWWYPEIKQSNKSAAEGFALKLIEEYEAGRVKSAIALFFSLEGICSKLDVIHSYPLCFVNREVGSSDCMTGSGRIKYDIVKNGKRVPDHRPPHGTLVMHLPSAGSEIKFKEVFSRFGTVRLPEHGYSHFKLQNASNLNIRWIYKGVPVVVWFKGGQFIAFVGDRTKHMCADRCLSGVQYLSEKHIDSYLDSINDTSIENAGKNNTCDQQNGELRQAI
jgi:hypothetical protein